MATIVQHRSSGYRYVLLGTGFGAFKATKPNWLLGNLMADEHSGELSVVAICDDAGQIHWCESRELTVMSVDGMTPQAALAGV